MSSDAITYVINMGKMVSEKNMNEKNINMNKNEKNMRGELGLVFIKNQLVWDCE